MKKLLYLLILLTCGASAQTTYKLNYDTVKLSKDEKIGRDLYILGNPTTVNGNTWLLSRDSVTGKIYRIKSSAISGNTYTAGFGLALIGFQFIVDSNTVALKASLAPYKTKAQNDLLYSTIAQQNANAAKINTKLDSTLNKYLINKIPGKADSAHFIALINAKEPLQSGVGFVKKNGTTTTYDNTTYYPASNPNGYISNSTETDPIYIANGVPKTRQVIAGFNMLGGGNLGTDITLTADTTKLRSATRAVAEYTLLSGRITGVSDTTASLFRTKANSQTLAQLQTRFNNYLTTANATATYVPQARTVAGFALSSNITLANHTAGYGLTGSAYNGSAAQTWLVDTAGTITSRSRFATAQALSFKYTDTTSAFNTLVHKAQSETITGAKIFTPSTATGTNQNGTIFNQSAIATANGGLFTTVTINAPTVTVGSFTGSSTRALTVNGLIQLNGSTTISSGLLVGNSSTFNNAIMASPGTPTSTATQQSSTTLAFASNLWTGSASTLRYNNIFTTASTTVNLVNRMSFIVGSTSPTTNSGGIEAFNIYSSGNVGIGTASTDPLVLFGVNGTSKFNADINLNYTPTTSSNNSQVLTRNISTGIIEKADFSAFIARSSTIVSSNITMSLNADYLNTTATQYTFTLPTTTGFAADGSKVTTVLVTGAGGAIIRVPSGYAMQSGTSFATTTGTGGVTLTQGQKVQIIPVGTNSFYLQPLNGSVTLY